MIAGIVVLCMVIFLAAYLTYGRFLAKELKLDPARTTPAVEINDGVDYVPAKATLLIGQHFSAIAAAGPIVGPVLAAIWFGWAPALLWIVLGSVFIGGVHDFASLAASIRHKAASIGQIVREHMSRTSYVLFLTFVWLTLMYVIIAFTDITAQTFKAVSAEVAYGPGVAASSVLYLLLAVAMGVVLYRFKANLTWTTVVFVPLVLGIVWLGPRLPAAVLGPLGTISVKQWDVLLLIYCFIASIVPMWALLQPRGYLGGWLLYLTIATGLIGALFGGFACQYPAFNLDGLKSLANGRPLFPILFITVACGACSGFHGIVSSGTTSKQLQKETDALPIGYGAMLLEGLVAVLALATVMMLPKGDAMLKSDPNLVYANGLARYLGLVGVGFSVAFPFALLAFSTFVYDTLDVCTRLARYIAQELLGLQSRVGGYIATAASLALPMVFLLLTKEKGYLVAWPIFGTSNQLMASLTLVAISVWLRKTGRPVWYALVPTFFMAVMTMWSLVLLCRPFLAWLFAGAAEAIKPDAVISGVCSVLLLVLSLWVVFEAARVFGMKKPAPAPAAPQA
jgi:carbon starvation protein